MSSVPSRGSLDTGREWGLGVRELFQLMVEAGGCWRAGILMSCWLALRVDIVIRLIKMHVNLKYLSRELAWAGYEYTYNTVGLSCKSRGE